MFFIMDWIGRFLYGEDYDKLSKRPVKRPRRRRGKKNRKPA
jgi:hypothetical protein